LETAKLRTFFQLAKFFFTFSLFLPAERETLRSTVPRERGIPPLGIDNVRVGKGRKSNAIILSDYVDATIDLAVPYAEEDSPAPESGKG
jgi:hypothetical protein